jgi:multidrug efflux pump subunit AcrA (membrane-fusion protein)
VEVEKGDIAPVLTLSLKPDEFEKNNYSVERSDLVVDKINVSVGDRVEAGEVMVSFKADDIQETIDTYTQQKEEDELLIDHYTKLMAIDSSQDYSDDIASLKEDMELADLYINEQNEKLKEYQLIAEKSGTVTYMYEWLEYGWAEAYTALVTVVSGSSNYTVDTDDDYDFQVGDIYQAEFGIATFDMKIIDITSYVDDSTGKDMRTILFEPQNDMAGVTESDTLTMTINKPVIKNVVYVDKNAVTIKSDTSFVYTIDENGYRTPVEVEIGEQVDDYIVITSGLDGGEQVTLN